MSVELQPQRGGEILVVQVTGQLTAEHYRRIVPEIDRLILDHGKISLVVEMKDFHGWTVSALWEDLKLSLKHFSHVERVALIGEKRWEEWIAAFCRPFTSAEVRYFDQNDAAAARDWVELGKTTQAP